MASSILESLRFQNFIVADNEVASSLGYGSTEGKAGVPRYNGDPGRFAEWQFRVRTRQLREKTLSEEEHKKIGPLGLRLLEGLSGHALQVAQLMDIEQLAGEEGAQKLMDHLQVQLRNRREQQARELYEAGAMVGGFLSRQPTETMAQFVLRRRAWYRALTDLPSELKLPDIILAEQLLNNSGLSSDQKLMIRTTLAGKVTFDGVAQELVNQHPHIQDRGRFGHRHHQDRGHRPPTWTWGRGKGYSKERQRLAFFQDYDHNAADHDGDDADYNDLTDDHAAYHGYTNEQDDEAFQYEAGDFAQENLAMLCEQGLDTDDQDACETAAEIIQADFEAYWTKKGASSKGQKDFRPPPFEISGSFTLDEKKAKLQQLKARTTCRKCGAVGHWSGDAQCPLLKGKGKSHLSRAGAPPSSTSATSSKAPPRENPHAGRQPAKSKPRTVYFSIKEHHGPGDGTALLAFRTPGNFNRAPPPDCLRDPPPVPAPGPPHKSDAASTNWSIIGQELAGQEPAWLSDLNADDDMAMLIDSLGMPETPFFADQPAIGPPLAQAALPPLPRPGAQQQQPRLGELEAAQRRDTTGPGTPSRRPTPSAAPASPPTHSTAPGPDRGRECQHLRTTGAGSNQHFRVTKCKDCGVILERVRRDSAPAPPSVSQTTCQHHNVTWKGSNGFQRVMTCRQCTFCAGALSGGAGTAPTTTPLSDQLLNPSEAWHIIETFRQAMHVKLSQVASHQAVPALRLTIEQSALWTDVSPQDTAGQPHASPAQLSPQGLAQTSAASTASPGPRSPQGMAQTSAPSTASPGPRSPQGMAQTSAPSTASPGPRSPTWPTGQAAYSQGMSPAGGGYQQASPQSPGLSSMVHRAAETVTFGRFKGRHYRDAWNDASYRAWVIEESSNTSSRGLKQLKQFFVDYTRYLEMGNPSAFMATSTSPTSATETDLIAILDTGCNQSCHGERWLMRYAAATNTTPVFVDNECPTFRGINGSVRATGTRNIELCLELLNGGLARGDLRSTEIADSEAPLLISLQAQRSLGLVIDIAAEVAHSQALGADLKLVINLLGLRLLPAAVAEDAADIDGADRDGGDSEHETEEGDSGHDSTDDLRDYEQGNSYLAIDGGNTRAMSKQQGDRVDSGLRDVASKDKHLWNQLSSKEKRRRHTLLPRGCKTFLLEVFAGVAMLSHIASNDFGFPISHPVDIRYDPNFDLTTAKGRRNVEEIIDRDDPYAITFSPVCTPWSPWMHMTLPHKMDELEATKALWRSVFKWIGKVTRDRLARGRQVLVEHPWSSEAWNDTDLYNLLQEAPQDAATAEPFQAVRADQCQFGLRDPRSGLPHLKPTGFATATEALKYKLNSRCPGDHCHQVLEGGDRCRKAQDWPSELCVAIVEGFMESMDHSYTKAAFPAEAEIEQDLYYNTLSSIDGIYDDNDLAAIDNTNLETSRLDEQREVEREEGPPPPPHEALESEALRQWRQRWRQLPYTQRVALRRLHTMTGHASTSAMKRLLRTAGADTKAIAALDHFRCPVCENTKMPAPTPATKLPSEYKFNEEIAIDTFIAKDTTGAKYKVMSLVDMGTLFHVVGIVGRGDGPPSSAECADMLNRSWLSWAGPPKSAVMDRGVENRGQLQGLLKGHGVLLRFIGLGSPNQLGRG